MFLVLQSNAQEKGLLFGGSLSIVLVPFPCLSLFLSAAPDVGVRGEEEEEEKRKKKEPCLVYGKEEKGKRNWVTSM